MRKTILIFTALMGLMACSSIPVHHSLDRVQPGMDKGAVLDSAGNPKRTFREHGEDHWIYVYFEGGKELSREVIFESGKVERITKPRAKANWDKELEGATSGAGPGDAGFKSVP